jgi:hypothetical protein
MIESQLGSSIDNFDSRAELCALAADLAAQNEDGGAASKWVRECWSNLIAYGYHKDMLLDQCLDAAEHLQGAGWGADALDLLARLAPAVVAVGDFTDGDETRHLPAELGRIMFNLDPAHSGRGFWSQCWVDRAFGSFLTFRDNLTFGEVIPKCAIHLEICGSPVITRGSRISAASTSFVNFYECCNSAISWLTSLHIHAAIADTVYRR